MKNITQLALTAIATLALGTAVLAEAAPEGGKGGRGRGGRPGGPPSPDRIVAQYGQVASYDTNKDGKLDATETQAITAAVAAGTIKVPAGRPGPEGEAPDASKVVERMTRMYPKIAAFDTNHDGALDDNEVTALKTAMENGELKPEGGRGRGPRGGEGDGEGKGEGRGPKGRKGHGAPQA
jgi:hypothetical protein